MRTVIAGSITEIGAAEWNALAGDDWPFLRHEFLAAAETTGCVSPDTGWRSCYLGLRDDHGRLAAALPLYEKSHSFGEFVFDWAWAQAYQRLGLDYYPKLVSAIPFTPAPCRKLLIAPGQDAALAAELVTAARQLALQRNCSSLHIQFPLAEELGVLAAAGLRLRKDCQFHWHNRGYRDFDDFLRHFSSAKRKKARRDRRRVAEQGIRFRWLHGDEMNGSLWQKVYELIHLTFRLRGSLPYYNVEFFLELSRRLPGNILIVLAEQRRRPIAAAVFYVGKGRLYGRYWGADADYDALHFETCYYQGIDYCIRHELEAFEPGTQGEHKISRGFLPAATWSAHWLSRPEFFDAVGKYLDDERRHVDRYIDAVHAHSPYRKAEADD